MLTPLRVSLALGALMLATSSVSASEDPGLPNSADVACSAVCRAWMGYAAGPPAASTVLTTSPAIAPVPTVDHDPAKVPALARAGGKPVKAPLPLRSSTLPRKTVTSARPAAVAVHPAAVAVHPALPPLPPPVPRGRSAAVVAAQAVAPKPEPAMPQVRPAAPDRVVAAVVAPSATVVAPSEVVVAPPELAVAPSAVSAAAPPPIETVEIVAAPPKQPEVVGRSAVLAPPVAVGAGSTPLSIKLGFYGVLGAMALLALRPRRQSVARTVRTSVAEPIGRLAAGSAA